MLLTQFFWQWRRMVDTREASREETFYDSFFSESRHFGQVKKQRHKMSDPNGPEEQQDSVNIAQDETKENEAAPDVGDFMVDMVRSFSEMKKELKTLRRLQEGGTQSAPARKTLQREYLNHQFQHNDSVLVCVSWIERHT